MLLWRTFSEWISRSYVHLGAQRKKVKISLLHVIKSLAQNLVIVTILLLLFILSECNFFPNPLSGYPKKLKKNKNCPLQLLQADCCDYWFQSAQCNNNATVSYGQLWYWVIFFAWLIYLLSTLRVLIGSFWISCRQILIGKNVWSWKND